MFVQDLETGAYRRVSPGVGKTTCGYFAPDSKKIIFSSTHLDADAKKHYAVERAQREEERRTKTRRRYVWDFDPYMSIFEANPDGSELRRLSDAPGYNAEASYTPDGKQIVFCSNRSGPQNLELYIMDADGKNVRQLTHAPGCYNGGPFFSPDGKRVIFRSDRKKKEHLQLYVINADGTGERALTDNENWVYWAPYWFRDGQHIIYTAADHSDPKARPNYDLYWMRIPESRKNANTGLPSKLRRSALAMNTAVSAVSADSPAILFPFCSAMDEPASAKTVRLTYFPGADVLPVFSPDGRKLLWTSTRTADRSSQLFLANFTPPEDE